MDNIIDRFSFFLCAGKSTGLTGIANRRKSNGRTWTEAIEKRFSNIQQCSCPTTSLFLRSPTNSASPIPEPERWSALIPIEMSCARWLVIWHTHSVWPLPQRTFTGRIGYRKWFLFKQANVVSIHNIIMFFLTHYRKKIESVDQNEKRLPSILIPIFSNHKMYGLTAITSDCPLYFSPCQINNGGCSADRVCLAHDSSPGGRVCICQESAINCSQDPEVY